MSKVLNDIADTGIKTVYHLDYCKVIVCKDDKAYMYKNDNGNITLMDGDKVIVFQCNPKEFETALEHSSVENVQIGMKCQN